MAYFIEEKNKEMIAAHKGGDRKWITIGGSYAGALSAWFKAKYPTHAVGAWSSSGVVNAIEDFKDYDKDIFEATSLSGAACPKFITDVNAYIDSVFDSIEPKDQEKIAIYNAFETTEAVLDIYEFRNMIADIPSD